MAAVSLSPRQAGKKEAPSPRASRVLIVSPHFPPINAADHHRVRLALPYFARHGWTAEVLAVRPADVEAVLDPALAKSLPVGLRVHEVKAWPVRWTRRMGWSSLAARARRNLRIRGDALLRTSRFDLVFFSTTQFGVLPLGPYWKRRHGVPYVLDFQDEWVSSYYHNHPEVEPPGGRFKYGLSRWQARRQEPRVIREAAQIVSVSRSYGDLLRERYPSLPSARFHELPFGGAAADFDHLDGKEARQNLFDPADGRRHCVYAGRGGEDMKFAATASFLALRRALDAGILEANGVRLHLIGTSYAPGARAKASFRELAGIFGLEGIVAEHPGRVPYFTALRCLRDASSLLLFGSDDPGYTASKIYPAILARRPLVAILHEKSPAVQVLRATRTGTVITFRPSASPSQAADLIFRDWFSTRAFDHLPPIDEEAVESLSAERMTGRLCRILDVACTRASRP